MAVAKWETTSNLFAVVRDNHKDCGLIFLNEKINGSAKIDVVG